MGKTSILYQLPRLLGPDFAAGWLDCQRAFVSEGKAVLLARLTTLIHEALRRRRVASPPPLAPADLERAAFDGFDRWLDEAVATMPPRMRLLICLDEYESLERITSPQSPGWPLGEGEEFLNLLRNLMQHQRRLVLMFAGARRFGEMGRAYTSRFLNVNLIRVSFLSRADLAPMLTRPVEGFDAAYAPGALEALLDATNGHPMLTQATACSLVNGLNSQKRRQATPEDVRAAIDDAIKLQEEYFRYVWNDAGPAGQEVLLSILEGRPPASDNVTARRPRDPGGSPDAFQLYSVDPAEVVANARRRLREQDVLDDAGAFTVPMLAQGLRTHLPSFTD
jgi:hypothetical protein